MIKGRDEQITGHIVEVLLAYECTLAEAKFRLMDAMTDFEAIYADDAPKRTLGGVSDLHIEMMENAAEEH